VNAGGLKNHGVESFLCATSRPEIHREKEIQHECANHTEIKINPQMSGRQVSIFVVSQLDEAECTTNRHDNTQSLNNLILHDILLVKGQGGI